MNKLQKTFTLLLVPIMLSGCNLQNRLLYYPSPTVPSAAALKSEGLQLWAATANDYRGLVAAAESGTPRGTVVVFHGNGGTALDRGFYVEELGMLGLRVILAEYPQYGGRPGILGEKAFVRDAAETLRLAAAQYGGPLYILGESLGGGVAAGVIREASVKIDGVILITPWDTLAALAKRHYPHLPVSLILTDPYDNIANLGAFQGRIAVVGAEKDQVIPVAHAQALFAALPSPAKQLWTIPGAGHNDWINFATQSNWQAIVAFVTSQQRP